MKSLWIPLAGLLLAAPLLARADVAPDPCDGKQMGDACMTYDNKAGTCVTPASGGSGLVCQETPAATSSGTTSGAGGSSSSGSSEESSGCSVHPGAASGAPALWLLLGASLVARRRRR